MEPLHLDPVGHLEADPRAARAPVLVPEGAARPERYEQPGRVCQVGEAAPAARQDAGGAREEECVTAARLYPLLLPPRPTPPNKQGMITHELTIVCAKQNPASKPPAAPSTRPSPGPAGSARPACAGSCRSGTLASPSSGCPTAGSHTTRSGSSRSRGRPWAASASRRGSSRALAWPRSWRIRSGRL